MRASSSGIPLHNDAIAPRERGAPRPSEAPLTGLTEGTEGIAARDRELRVFCRRLLGLSEARSVQVDDAVEGVITAVARGLPIALRGTSDLVPVAYALHRRIVGVDRPFVVCDPRRREIEGSVCAPPNRRTVALALEEWICYEVLELEALANAANTAIDECAPPSESRRSFDRAQALIGNAAEKAAAAVALIGELKTAVNAYISDRRQG
jgi:hypothetical protein